MDAIPRNGLEGPAPATRSRPARPGLPGRRRSRWPRRRRDLPGRAAGARGHDLRRPAPRSWGDGDPLEARRAARTSGWSTRPSTPSTSRGAEPGARDRLLRDRLRDDCTGDRDTLLRARAAGVRNFSAFCNDVTIVPPLRAILDTPGTRIDALIGAGPRLDGDRDRRRTGLSRRITVNRSSLLPSSRSTSSSRPAMIFRQRAEGRCERREPVMRAAAGGEPAALAAIAETMELRETFEWRGLGFIPWSALQPRDPPSPPWDAEAEGSGFRSIRVPDPKACQCGQVLRRRDQAAGSARSSARPARPSGRWARAWSRAKAPARRTILWPRVARARRQSRHPCTRLGREGDAEARRGSLREGPSTRCSTSWWTPPLPTGSRSRPTLPW